MNPDAPVPIEPAKPGVAPAPRASSPADIAAWLRLTHIRGLGPRALHKLLTRFGLPTALFACEPAELREVLPETLVGALFAPPPAHLEALIKKTIAWAEQKNHHFLTLADAAYPARLLSIADPPPILHVCGRLELLQQRHIAVVGSRGATLQGIRNARAFSRALSEAGWTVCSGLALGIDTAAHEGGLEGRGSSVAVVGTGLDRVYPAANLALARKLADSGALVSEFPLCTAPLARHFPQRNRIIAGLAHAVLVVEAAARSGSLITARLASEQGRDVFAIPGSIHAPLARGCHRLIRQGALLVECADDVLDELDGRTRTSRPDPRVEHHNDDALLNALGAEPVGFDQLVLQLDIDPGQLTGRLLELELEERITRLPGERYQRLA